MQRACAGDAELLAEVLSLLAHHDHEDDGLGDECVGIGHILLGAGISPQDANLQNADVSPETHGDRTGRRPVLRGFSDALTRDAATAGRYRLIRRIAEGGMGRPRGHVR